MNMFKQGFLLLGVLVAGCGNEDGAADLTASSLSSVPATLKEQYADTVNEKYMGERAKATMTGEVAMSFKRLEVYQSISSPEIPDTLTDYLNDSINFGQEINRSFNYSDDAGSVMVSGSLDSGGLGVLEVEFIGCAGEYCRGNVANGFAQYEVEERVRGLISKYSVYYDGVILTPVKVPNSDNFLRNYILDRAEIYGYNTYHDHTPDDVIPDPSPSSLHRLILVTDLISGAQTLSDVDLFWPENLYRDYGDGDLEVNKVISGNVYFSGYGNVDFEEYFSYPPSREQLTLTGAGGLRARITGFSRQVEVALDQVAGGSYEINAIFENDEEFFTVDIGDVVFTAIN